MNPATVDRTDVGEASTQPAGAGTTEQVGLDLAREMRRRWRGGERPRAEEFLSRDPGLGHRPEAAVELIYEEYCLRRGDGAGDGVAHDLEQDILRRFPQWAGPLRVMLDCHRHLLESQRERPLFPAVGERVGEFRLVAELFRGPRARVFVAEQMALADRPVVLKVTARDGSEHLSLARLQHTHIVPLYSVADDAGRKVRVLCMPYFGRATLASVLDALAAMPHARRGGADVATAINAAQGGCLPAAPPGARRAPSLLEMLKGLSYADAMAWVAACVADALAFAHERGVVHLDLKPSNVLLTADGTPMLLDFHLARGPLCPGAVPAETFGGTPGYMPPEQQEAMRALRGGLPVAVPVDGRADVYALGAILYEALGGVLPVRADSPALSAIDAGVSPGLSDIVSRCLTTSAEGRYPDAASLADDLRRHLSDRPLAGVANRSLAERWRKWRRRRPGGMRAAVAAALLAVAGGVVVAGVRDRLRQAEVALADAERQIGDRHYSEAVASLERGLAVAQRVPLGSELRGRVGQRLEQARRMRLAEVLHRVADEVRPLYGADTMTGGELEPLAAQCTALWRQREALSAALAGGGDAVAADLRDVALFAAGVRARLSGETPAAHREALTTLEEVEAAFGPSAVLVQGRRVHQAALGLGPGVAGAAAPAPRTAWEHLALGRSMLVTADLPGAARELAAALALDPGGRWTNFYYGQCLYRQGRYEEAAAALGVCIGAAPDAAGGYYNRALAYAAAGDSALARRDCDSALRLDPRHTAARVLRDSLVE